MLYITETIKQRKLFRILAVLLLAVTLLAGCDTTTSPLEEEEIELSDVSDHNTSVAIQWFDLSLQLIEQTPGFTPPVASRALGYKAVTLYETVVHGMPGYNSMAGHLNELESMPVPAGEVHWHIAANSALAEITRNLFRSTGSELLEAIDDLEEVLAGEFRAQTDINIFDRSMAYGREIAGVIYSWSKSDGGHEGFATNFPDDYHLPTGPDLWIPTPPDYLPALQPYWGYNRPFVLSSPGDCPVKDPPAYSEETGSVFYAEAKEVYETVRQLSEEQRDIALFWADDPGLSPTPPGHWVSILNQVLVQHDYTLDTAAEAYARLGIALADAFIVCWYEKYHYNLLRPITYIQQVIDTDWNKPEVTDPVITPPFPEYPSGHSVQSGAAAVVLTDLFGDLAFTNRTHETRGLGVRSFSSFWEAAEEAAISRLYGGIHYRFGIELGVEHGRCIGERVSAMELKY